MTLLRVGDHLRRDAYLYVRQSSLRQVFENTESTQRQYALREHAVGLGWSIERIHVIDNDLGIFDYPRFAEPLRDRIRQRAQDVCAAAGVEIEHVNKSHVRKEDRVARVLARRGDHPGLVHVISAMGLTGEASTPTMPYRPGSGNTA